MDVSPDPADRQVDRAFCQQPAVALPVRQLLGQLVQDCGASEATLWVLGADGQAMAGAVNHGATPHILESASVPVAESVVGLVMATGVAQCIGPDDPHNPTIDALTGLKVQAMAAAPVHVRGQRCGVLSVVNPVARATFDGRNLDKVLHGAQAVGDLLTGILERRA